MNRSVDEMICVLDVERDVVMSSCISCPSIRTRPDPRRGESPMDVYVTARATCKKCMFQIARRKYAALYVREYLEKYGRKYFKTSDVCRYISEVFAYHDLIKPFVQIFITDMVRNGIVKIFSRHNNGHRYIVVQENFQRGVESIERFAIARKFRYKYGYEKME